jgi:hypothetical protein
MRSIEHEIIASMRKAHAKEMRRMRISVRNENKIPPIPDPPLLMPLARLRFFKNHCDKTERLGIYENPIPAPTITPCEMYSCQISCEKLADM